HPSIFRTLCLFVMTLMRYVVSLSSDKPQPPKHLQVFQVQRSSPFLIIDDTIVPACEGNDGGRPGIGQGFADCADLTFEKFDARQMIGNVLDACLPPTAHLHAKMHPVLD